MSGHFKISNNPLDTYRYIGCYLNNDTLNFISEEEDEGLKDCDGYCDDTIKTLVVKQYKRGEPGSKKALDLQEKKNFRHEIIHAFLCESGLAENSTWAQEEEMVDWFGKQFPKLAAAFREVDAL